MSPTLRARKRAVANVLAVGVLAGAPSFLWATVSWAGVAALALVVAATAALVWRGATLRAELTADEVLARNLLRTHRLARADVVAWERRRSLLVSTRWVDGICPVAVTRSGRVTLLALPEDRLRVPFWARGDG